MLYRRVFLIGEGKHRPAFFSGDDLCWQAIDDVQSVVNVQEINPHVFGLWAIAPNGLCGRAGRPPIAGRRRISYRQYPTSSLTFTISRQISSIISNSRAHKTVSWGFRIPHQHRLGLRRFETHRHQLCQRRIEEPDPTRYLQCGCASL